MPDRGAGSVGEQILLRHVRGVLTIGVFLEQMIEWLILAGSDLGRDRKPPFLGIVERGIDIEDHASERVEPMPDHLADLEFGSSRLEHEQRGMVHPVTRNCPAQAQRIPARTESNSETEGRFTSKLR